MLRTLGFSTAAALVAAQAPTQITLHPSALEGELSLDFVGKIGAANGLVQFGAHGQSAQVATTNFEVSTIGQMHQAVLSFAKFSLGVGESGWYRCTADGTNWSTNYTIHPIVATPRIAIFGDFGIANDVIMTTLAKDSAAGVFDFVHHVGDFAYDFEEQGSSVGNAFQQASSQSYAAAFPTSVVPGNHEACGGCPAVPGLEHSRGNFSEYRARFASVIQGAGAASGSNSNIFYSFELGLTHYIGFSAEAYAYNSGAELLANQLAFMKADLAAVNRTKTPWVVALVHKDWNMESAAYAEFYPVLEAGAVDALFCGHIHYYNRNMPYNAVTKETDAASVSGPTNNQVYTNPKFMVNIVTGASGDKEGETPCVVNVLPPSVTCDADFGYGLWTAVDANTATWSFKSVKQDWPFGPTNYTDNLTIKKSAARRGE